MTSSSEAISRRSETGSKILPCPQELLAEHPQKLTVFGQGESLSLGLLSHMRGDYSLHASFIPQNRRQTGQAPQHFLYFLPLPQGQGSLRPTLLTLRCATAVRVAA